MDGVTRDAVDLLVVRRRGRRVIDSVHGDKEEGARAEGERRSNVLWCYATSFSWINL